MPAKHNFLPYDKKALKPLLHLLPNQNQNAYSLIWDLQFPRNEGFNPILLFDTQFHLIGIRHRPIIFSLSLTQNFTEETRTSNSQIVSFTHFTVVDVVRFPPTWKRQRKRYHTSSYIFSSCHTHWVIMWATVWPQSLSTKTKTPSATVSCFVKGQFLSHVCSLLGVLLTGLYDAACTKNWQKSCILIRGDWLKLKVR